MTGYCPAHDPILAAGWLTCHPCGAVSYPVQAEWIDGGLILAEYEDGGHHYGCPNRHAKVVLVDLGAKSEDVPAVIRPRSCRAMAATTGRQCRKPARPGSAYCTQHNPDREEAR